MNASLAQSADLPPSDHRLAGLAPICREALPDVESPTEEALRAMQPQPKPYFNPEEYLAFERQAETKSEYWNGQIYALAGATENHVLIVANAVSALVIQVKGRPCKVYPQDMRVKVSAAGLYT